MKLKVTKTDSQTIDNIHIYPNPALDIIHLKGLTGIREKIILYDVNGKKTDVNLKSDNNIDISHLTKGMYHMVIQREGRMISKSIIKL